MAELAHIGRSVRCRRRGPVTVVERGSELGGRYWDRICIASGSAILAATSKNRL